MPVYVWWYATVSTAAAELVQERAHACVLWTRLLGLRVPGLCDSLLAGLESSILMMTRLLLTGTSCVLRHTELVHLHWLLEPS